MLKGAHDGKKIISGGMLGVPFQSHCPNKANQILVKIRTFGIPPLDKMNSRAFRSGSESGECPASWRAK